MNRATASWEGTPGAGVQKRSLATARWVVDADLRASLLHIVRAATRKLGPLDVGPTEPDIRLELAMASQATVPSFEGPDLAAAAARPPSDVRVTRDDPGPAAAPNAGFSRPSLPIVVPMNAVARPGWRALAAVVALALVAGTLAVATRPHRPPTAFAQPTPFGPPSARDEIPAPAAVADEPSPVVASRSAGNADRAARKLGRLALRGSASTRKVYLDGKRLLGSGVRTFDVTCGMHTIAIGNKSETREIDIACQGELVLSR